MDEEGDLPLRVTSAALRSVVSGRHAEHYGRVVDFVDVVWQQTSSLITYRHYLKLTLAFKAKLVMEMFVRQCSLLDILQTLDKYFPPLSSADPRASRTEVVKEQQCRLQFRRLVLRLVRDGAYRHHFLQGDVEQEFGALFMAAAQALFWEFLERIENILPPLRIEQTRAGSMDTGSLSPDKQPLADCSRTLPDRLLHPPQQRQRHRSGNNGSASEKEPEPEPERGVAPPGSRCLASSMMGSGERRLARSSPGGGGGEARPRSPRSPVPSSFHFDQWSDEEPGRCPPLPRSPPDPLQSQRAESLPAGAATVCDQRGRSGAGRAGTSRGPGTAGRGSGSLGRLTHLGLDLQRLSSAPVPREVGEQLARCQQFQPTVLLLRLSNGQMPQGDTAAAGRDRQRRPATVRGGPACMGTESEEGSLLCGESQLSDPSDNDYYPFCSQDVAQVYWLQRNSLGQFTTRYRHVDGNPD